MSSSLDRVLDFLAKEGLVERVSPEEIDEIAYRLTPEGERFLAMFQDDPHGFGEGNGHST